MDERTYPKSLLYNEVPPPVQLEGEPDLWYNRFIDYYLLQVPNYKKRRNLTRAYQLWRIDEVMRIKIQEEEDIASGKKKRAKSSSRYLPPAEKIPPLSLSDKRRMARMGGDPTWKKKSEEFNWSARALGWDQQYAMWHRSKWFQRQEELREEQWRLGLKLTHKGEEIVDQPLYEEIQKQGGKTVIKKPGRWLFSDGASFISDGLEILNQASTTQEFNSDMIELVYNMEKAGMIPMEVVVEASAMFERFQEEFNAKIRGYLIASKDPVDNETEVNPDNLEEPETSVEE